MDTCKSCLYANEKSDGGVFCDKVVLLYGKEVHIGFDEVNLPCPSHSNRFIPETRAYFTNEDIRDSENSCGVCGRLVDLSDESQYGYIEIQDDAGSPAGEKLQCKICRHKGRR